MVASEQTLKDSITVTIDGSAYTLPKGEKQSIISVCDSLGIAIPRFCYHPHLSTPGNCRMCLVEVEGIPKLLPSCHTDVTDGMVIHTSNERVQKARKAVLELLLVNHPVDCPICDQAGECPLQDQYYEHNLCASVAGPPEWKVKKGKAVRVGPRVTLDQERCVLCTRCTRFMAEIAGEPQLGMFWRNDHAYISTPTGKELDSNYSLNAVAICPVGALTSTDFRFKKRVWELQSIAGLCDACSRGCNLWLDCDGNKVYRYSARENPAVNQCWMCDHGQLSYKNINERRLITARIGKGASPIAGVSVDAARKVADQLSASIENQEEMAFLVSPRVSTEDALLAAWFFSEVMKADAIYCGGREDGEQDSVLLRGDRNPNRLGLTLAAEAFGLQVLPFSSLVGAIEEQRVGKVLALGADVPIEESIAVDLFSRLDYLAVLATNHSELTKIADLALPAATNAEYDGTFVNFAGCLQRFYRAFEPRGESAPYWDWIGVIAQAMGYEVPYVDSAQVFGDLAPRSPVFGHIEWDTIAEHGVVLPGVGEADDTQSAGRAVKDQKGVSRWPR